jgi:hypothetical protein
MMTRIGEFAIGSWDHSYININVGATPVIAIYIAQSKNDILYSLYRWDNVFTSKFDFDEDHKLRVTGVDEI